MGMGLTKPIPYVWLRFFYFFSNPNPFHQGIRFLKVWESNSHLFPLIWKNRSIGCHLCHSTIAISNEKLLLLRQMKGKRENKGINKFHKCIFFFFLIFIVVLFTVYFWLFASVSQFLHLQICMLFNYSCLKRKLETK